MADDGLIAAYLREFDYSVAALSDRAELVAEAEDHLYELTDRLMRDGRTSAEAEVEAVARFGSAALVARICVVEAKRGVAVPTSRTRAAGRAALLTPVLLGVGQYLNVTVDRGFVHGIGVMALTAAIPAFVFGLWGLRARHGGLGRLGRTAIAAAVVSPSLSFAGYYGLFAAIVLLALSVIVLVVEMLRANVLPVAPLVLLTAGPVAVTAILAGAELMGGDAGEIVVYAMSPSVVGFVWLGWHLWSEPAVDGAHSSEPVAAA
jgi:hypothetical protein